MVLLIIADDFTGALDTGVQFAARGIRTRVVVGANAKLTQQDTDVLVVDTETRHLPAAQAYAAVEGLVQRAKRAGFAYLYKKTDSALRGNVGAELAALLNASGSAKRMSFPARPPCSMSISLCFVCAMKQDSPCMRVTALSYHAADSGAIRGKRISSL